jgi:hypothetical protein
LHKLRNGPSQNFVDVALVRFDVIAEFRRRDDAALQAEVAERMRKQLVFPDPGPPSR